MPPVEASSQPALAASPPDRIHPLVLRLVGHMLEEEGDLLARWRARLVAALLLATATLGIALVFSTISILVRDGQWPLVALDSVLISLVFWLLVSRRASNRMRAYMLTVGSWLIGVFAITALGPFSTALGWLFTSVFLSAFLLGRRATIVAVVSILLLLAAVAVGISTDAFGWSTGDPTAMSRWLMLSLDFTFLIIVFAVANTLTFQLLEQEDRARVRAERQLAEGRRHQALGTLASGIAHDFNNLMVPMMSNVELAREAVPIGSDAHRALRDAHRSAERARDLVQRILAFSRGVDSQRQPMAVGAAVREAVDIMRSAVPADVALTVSVAPVPAVMASRAELHQILLNLLSNALQAVQSAGAVSVTVDAVGDALHRWIRLRVRDTGAGMDATVQERIFDPYFTTREGSRGTGLGLPIVRSIVDSMGGSIVAESTVGQGSTFTVLFPADTDSGAVFESTGMGVPKGASQPTPTAAAAGAVQGLGDRAPLGDIRRQPGVPLLDHAMPRRHVLLVEDDASVRRATARQLESLGYQVTVVESAPAAMRLCRTPPLSFDLLLTDHRMPGGTGRQLANDIWRQFPDAGVVLMSGDVNDAMGDEPAAGWLVPLQKPFSRSELAEALDQARRLPIAP